MPKASSMSSGPRSNCPTRPKRPNKAKQQQAVNKNIRDILIALRHSAGLPHHALRRPANTIAQIYIGSSSNVDCPDHPKFEDLGRVIYIVGFTLTTFHCFNYFQQSTTGGSRSQTWDPRRIPLALLTGSEELVDLLASRSVLRSKHAPAHKLMATSPRRHENEEPEDTGGIPPSSPARMSSTRRQRAAVSMSSPIRQRTLSPIRALQSSPIRSRRLLSPIDLTKEDGPIRSCRFLSPIDLTGEGEDIEARVNTKFAKVIVFKVCFLNFDDSMLTLCILGSLDIPNSSTCPS